MPCDWCLNGWMRGLCKIVLGVRVQVVKSMMKLRPLKSGPETSLRTKTNLEYYTTGIYWAELRKHHLIALGLIWRAVKSWQGHAKAAQSEGAGQAAGRDAGYSAPGDISYMWLSVLTDVHWQAAQLRRKQLRYITTVFKPEYFSRTEMPRATVVSASVILPRGGSPF